MIPWPDILPVAETVSVALTTTAWKRLQKRKPPKSPADLLEQMAIARAEAGKPETRTSSFAGRRLYWRDIGNKDAPAVGAQDQFVIARMYDQIVDGCSREVGAERQPGLTLVKADINAEVSAHIQDLVARGVLPDDIDRFNRKVCRD